MKISYDPKYDVLYLKFTEENVVDTIEVDGGVLIDYGEEQKNGWDRDHQSLWTDKSKSTTRDSYQASRRSKCLNSEKTYK